MIAVTEVDHAYMPKSRDDGGKECDVCKKPKGDHSQDVMFELLQHSGPKSRPDPLKTD